MTWKKIYNKIKLRHLTKWDACASELYFKAMEHMKFSTAASAVCPLFCYSSYLNLPWQLDLGPLRQRDCDVRLYRYNWLEFNSFCSIMWQVSNGCDGCQKISARRQLSILAHCAFGTRPFSTLLCPLSAFQELRHPFNMAHRFISGLQVEGQWRWGGTKLGN